MQRAPYWYGVFETRIQTAEFVNVIPRFFKGKFLIRGPGSVACLQTEVICRKLEGKKFSLFSLSGKFSPRAGFSIAQRTLRPRGQSDRNRKTWYYSMEFLFVVTH